MKNLSKRNGSLKKKLLLILAMLLIVGLLSIVSLKTMNDWFNTHYFKFSIPLNVSVQEPIQVKERKPQVVEKKLVLEYPEEIDTPIEKYICDKWGVYECKTALAVSKAENGTRQPDRFGVNTNDTIDVGIFQINSIHFKKEGCSLAEIVIAEKNVDCAYKIWQASGWSPWVAYKNGNYLGMLDK